MTVADRLAAMGAHRDVVAFAEPFGDDDAHFWAECPRGDWLLAIAIRAGDPREPIARAATSVLVLALDHLPDDDALARAVLEATTRRAMGGEGASEREIDALEESVVQGPDAAMAMARQAIAVAARALAPGGAFEDLALVPALLAQAAALDAGDCAMMAAVSYAQRRSAELVRAHLALPCSISVRAVP